MKRITIFFIFIAGMVFGQTMVWKTVTRMPLPVTGARAVVKDSLIYILGGYSDSLRTRVSTIQEYNPAQNTWRILSHSLIGKRVGFIAKTYQDSVIILGGISNSTSLNRSLEVWKFGAPPFLLTSNPNFDRSYCTGQVLRDKLYIVGGIFRNKADDSVSYLVEYDLKKKMITYSYDSLISPQFIPTQQMSEMLDSTMYLFGGIAQGFLSTIHRFEPWNKSYTRLLTSMPRGRANGTAVHIGEKKIMIIGGYSESSGALPTTEIYTINGNQAEMMQGPVLSSGGRSDHCAARWKNLVFVFGGMRSSGINHAGVDRLELPSVDVGHEEMMPAGFALSQNYPNPFNPSTSIRFTTAALSAVRIDIYSSLGVHVRTLAEGEYARGEYHVTWDGSDASGKAVPSGIYFYRLQSGVFAVTKKMVLLR